MDGLEPGPGDALDACGCCEPPPEPEPIHNPPGLAALRYRAGTHPELLQRMLAALPRERVAGNGDLRPLEDLGARTTDDPAIGLLDAWAVVADVLTFYQERIANEGFLRTATERRSLVELARAIGYELRPGVAASTFLAFTVDDSPASPGTATVPAGTKVQSVPSQGGLPQTFETSEEMQGRAAWNELRPRLTLPQPVDPDASTIYLQGAVSDLVPGELVLFVQTPDGQVAATPKQVAAVTPEPDLERTRVDLANPFKPPPSHVVTVAPIFAVPFLDATPFVGTSVDSYVVGGQWKEEELSAFLSIQGWDPGSLETTVAAPKPPLAAAEEGVQAFSLRLGVFGHNAPRYLSLHPDVRGSFNWDGGVENPPASIRRGSDGAYPDDLFFLERSVEEVVGGSWVVLEDEDSTEPYRVDGVLERSLADFALSARVTGLSVRDPDGGGPTGLDDFPMRTTTVHARSRPLPLAPLPIEATLGHGTAEETQLTLDSMVLGLRTGQAIVLTGERADLPGVAASEALVVEEVVHSGGLTTLVFDTAMQHPYVRKTVVLNANVARATHGESVAEVLGSGDAATRNQTFSLKRPPLTHVSAPTARGSESTLQVRVGGILWDEAESLFPVGPKDRAYAIRMDEDATRVVFGDGNRGDRLPSGLENVQATYRTGIGLAGQVAAGSLTLLQTRPPGIRAVTNPVAASGAADPEVLEDARSNAPLTVLTMDRIVSLRDYEDFARAFAGIGKAQAALLSPGRAPLVHLTVAGADGSAVPETSDLFASLREAIAAGAEPTLPFHVDSYRKVFFNLEASLRVDRRHRPEDVVAAVRAAVQDAFSFPKRRFGQAVSAAEVVSVIQAVPGVEALDLDALYRVEEAADPPSASVATVLVAATARLEGTVAHPAELLLVNPVGIDLSEMGE